MDYEKYKIKNKREHEHFMDLMKGLIERYKNRVQNAEKYDNLDEDFMVWHIIKDAYDDGYALAYNYFRNELFKLTDAEEHFKDKIRSGI